jgi:ABC-type glycerol-3-phosphate transport system permease component
VSYNILVYGLVGGFALFCFLPFWLIVINSFARETEILTKGYQVLPSQFSLDAYRLVFTGERIGRSYLITILVTSMGTGLSLLITSMLAYSLANTKVRYRHILSFFVYFTMLFSGGLVPWYILVTRYLRMGDTLLALFVPILVNAWNVFLLRNFFQRIHEDLLDAARIDGAHEVRIFFQVVLPLSLPALATIGLFYSLMYWNNWSNALMFINNRHLYPLQFLLRALVSNLMAFASSLNPNMALAEQLPSYGVRMATCVVTIGPIVLVYPFVQRYFIKGLTVGAIKG